MNYTPYDREYRGIEKICFDTFKRYLLYSKIISWDDNKICLDNGLEIEIVQTGSDCCACAYGDFTDVVLDAVITDVSDISVFRKEYADGMDEVTARVTMLHNQNLICRVNGCADNGNCGYYYSIASFVVKFEGDNVAICDLVET